MLKFSLCSLPHIHFNLEAVEEEMAVAIVVVVGVVPLFSVKSVIAQAMMLPTVITGLMLLMEAINLMFMATLISM